MDTEELPNGWADYVNPHRTLIEHYCVPGLSSEFEQSHKGIYILHPLSVEETHKAIFGRIASPHGLVPPV